MLRLNITHKISLFSALLVSFTALIIVWVFYTGTSKILVDNALTDISSKIISQGNKLTTHIDSQISDTIFLSQLKDIKSSTRETINNGHVSNIFESLLHSKSDYLQIRYIDNEGNERVRVERIDNKIVHVPAEKLQNKFNRYYVTDTLKLNNNQIFISEIDLNREYGKISEPHQAILRTATPVFSQSDEPAAGIIVINAEISHELEAIQKSVADSGRTIYITNDQGYYLLHPDPAKTFGFDKGTEELIQNDISSIAEFLSPDSKENNRFILPKHIESDSIYIFTKIFFDTLNTERYITVGIQEPYSIIKDRESSVLYNTLFSATIIIAFGIFLALIFSLKLLKPLKLITDTITNFVPGESPTQLLQINTNDEIGALSQAFRNMSDQVIDSQGNLINLNKNLEQLIDTRTNALSESKRMLQTILDTIPVRVYWKNINGEFMGCNSLFAKDTGLNSPQEVINKTDYDMPWKDHANSYKEKEQEIINNNSSFLHVEELQTHIDGTGKWIEYNKTPLTDTNNNIIGILGTYQDITLRKANELALIESESRQFAILQNMIDGVITINQYGIIQSFNNAAESIFGYTLDEVIGKNVSLLMPEPYKSSHDNYLNNYTTTGEAQIIGIGREVEGQRKNGDCFPLDLAVSEISSVDERLFVGIVRDITERQRIDKMKNEFISTVSHELRTPLTSIRGSLGLITGGAVGELPQQAREMLNIASNNTERLLMLINDILDIQKIESGLLTFKFNTIKLTPFLEQAIDNNKTYGNQYSVNFKLAHTIDNISVYADSDRLMQVMNNLMSNAAKFSPPNETVEISAAIHNDTIRISVTDNGPGIPEEFQPKLFDKFTQSDSSDNRAKEGTGLGLSITKMIVEKHGGRIGFISKQGIGTTF
ncbi:MAG: PAS domain S-box protein, partial [Gammaproteobacteria bacterium]|nr:PAS domain S-box protein [Gammaproteobacteria bacterium]